MMIIKRDSQTERDKKRDRGRQRETEGDSVFGFKREMEISYSLL